MCDCVKAAMDKGYIVRNSIYYEDAQDFLDTNDYFMPLSPEGKRGKSSIVKLRIKFCPICGERI